MSTGTIVGAAIGGYVLTVLLLYRFPCLLHTKKKKLMNGFLIAHRGGAGEYLENTMAAFRHAVNDCKADVLELDLHLTKDGKVVIAHDDWLERSCGRGGRIEDINYEDLPCLRQHIELMFHPGYFTERKCEDDRIPLFTELLEEFPDVGMNLDLKDGTQELVEKVGELLHQYGRERRTVWGGHSQRTTDRCYNYDKSIPVYFTYRSTLVTIFFFWTGLLAFLPIRESCYELPMVSQFLHVFADMSSKFVFIDRWVVKAFEALAMNRFIVGYLRRRGIPMWLFVLNTEEAWHAAYKRGCVGIHTDYPSRLRRFLNENPQYLRED